MNINNNNYRLEDGERIITHLETLFFEYGEGQDFNVFHPKPSNPINKNRVLYLLQMYEVVFNKGECFQGILYENEKSFVAKKKKVNDQKSFYDHRDIFSSDYMDEFNDQKSIFSANSKQEIIAQAKDFINKHLKKIKS